MYIVLHHQYGISLVHPFFYFYLAANFSETIVDERMQRLYKSDTVLADIQRLSNPVDFKLSNVPSAEKLEKLVEDVK